MQNAPLNSNFEKVSGKIKVPTEAATLKMIIYEVSKISWFFTTRKYKCWVMKIQNRTRQTENKMSMDPIKEQMIFSSSSSVSKISCGNPRFKVNERQNKKTEAQKQRFTGPQLGFRFSSNIT